MNSPMKHGSQKTIIGQVRERIYPLMSNLAAQVSLVEGKLKGTGIACRILFVHNCQFNSELRERSFVEPPRVLRRQIVFLPVLARLLRTSLRDYDIAIAVVPNLYSAWLRSQGNYEGREEVRQVIRLGGGWEELRGRFSKKKRQISNNFQEKSGLSYRVSQSEADFDYFFKRMYAPLIRRRYGARAELDPYDQAKAWFDSGFVIFVTKDDVPVAGALCELQGKTLLFRRSGVLDGDESQVKAGVQTALYYFQLRFAIESGLEAVDTLKTSPFLNDGVFRHKSDWGATTLRDDESTRRVFYCLSGSSECQAAFFEINPVVIETDEGLAALVGRRGSDADVADSGKSPVAASVLIAPGIDHIVELRRPATSGDTSHARDQGPARTDA